jgi:hypothetical protein
MAGLIDAFVEWIQPETDPNIAFLALIFSIRNFKHQADLARPIQEICPSSCM